nr:hypothetical protein [uncultured Actinoplanes sp.]
MSSSREVDLLRSLDDEPDSPSMVDVRRAIVTARRRRTQRAAGYAGAAAMTALAVTGGFLVAAPGRTQQAPVAASPSVTTTPPAYSVPGLPNWTAAAATAPSSCVLDRLPVPDDEPKSLVSGADPTGRYIVGRSYLRRGGYQAVLWRDGRAEKVMLPGNREESLQDVNTSGVAVGWSYANDGSDHDAPVPYAYRDGKVIKLPGIRSGSAYAINDAGAIVGDDNAGHPVVWPSPVATPFRLPVPAGVRKAYARGIDETGTVVGSLDLRRPYVWFADGTHRELPLPSLDGKQAVMSQAFGVRNGWVTGMASPDDVSARGSNIADARLWAVRWNLRTGEVAVTAALRTPADAVNAQGWQVGTDPQGYEVLVTSSGVVRLPDLADHAPDGLSTIATALSDDGRTIAGQSDTAAGLIQAVVWHCR